MVAGLIKIAYDSGFVTHIDCEIVHENDEFDYQQGTETKLVFKKNIFKDRGQVVAGYCVLTLKDGQKLIEIMTLDQIKKIESSSKNKSIWPKHWSEMARKTVIKRALKRVTKSKELAEIVQADNALERPDYSEENNSQLEDLNAKLETVEQTDVIDVTPIVEENQDTDVFDQLPTANDLEGEQHVG